jgi:3'(2'), 5'-bisphosphate nucleotidase
VLADVDAVARLCRQAGAKLMAWRGDRDATAEVEGRPGKLRADIALHDLMIEALAAISPGLPVISEEDLLHEDERPSRYWIIDPIDGTASWLGGFRGFVVQAALIVDGAPEIGVVHGPALDVLYSARRGHGALRNGMLIPRLVPSDRLIVVDNYPEPRRAAARLVSGLPGATYLESGSLGLKACLVADGTADLFVKDVMVRDWDMAPALVIAGETGAVMEHYAGGAYSCIGSIEKPDGVIVARDSGLAARARLHLAGMVQS